PAGTVVRRVRRAPARGGPRAARRLGGGRTDGARRRHGRGPRCEAAARRRPRGDHMRPGAGDAPDGHLPCRGPALRRPELRRGRPPRRPRPRGAPDLARDRAQGGEALMAIIVDRDTKLVVQGLTGSEGSFHGTRNKRYGTQVVAGVTPGKAGQNVEGIPVFDTVADAVAETGANT